MGARTYDPFTGRFLSPDPISYPHCIDLYHLANGDPINYFDPDGRFFIKAWENPRVQGTLQTIGGTGETIAGACMSLYSGGLATPLGFAVMAHGLDHTFTGLKTVWTGQSTPSVTQQLLEKTGMSTNMAANTDAILGFAGGTYSISNIFKNGVTIDELATSLKNGRITIDKVSPIRLVERNNALYTLDNRRLEAFRRAGIEIPYRLATSEEIASEIWKFSSKNGGLSIRIRGK